MNISKILKFSASWCGPCKAYAPIFHHVSTNPDFRDIEFIEYDVDDEEELSAKYNIRSIPTTLFINENNEVCKKISGAIGEEDLLTLIKDTLADGTKS